VTVAPALLPHLEPHPQWKARCLQVMGNTQVKDGQYRSAVKLLATATRLFLESGHQSEAAWYRSRAATSHRALGECDQAEVLLDKSRTAYSEMGNEFEAAKCRSDLGNLMREKRQFGASIQYSSTARQTFDTLGKTFYAAQCSASMGATYIRWGKP